MELWPRVAAMDHPNCSFELLWAHFVEPWPAQNDLREAQTHNVGPGP